MLAARKCLVCGMKGRKQRNVILERLLPLLWPGLTDREIALLRDIDSAKIKNLTVESRPVFETVEKHTAQQVTMSRNHKGDVTRAEAG